MNWPTEAYLITGKLTLRRLAATVNRYDKMGVAVCLSVFLFITYTLTSYTYIFLGSAVVTHAIFNAFLVSTNHIFN